MQLEIVIGSAREAELSDVEALLKDCGLPRDGLIAHWRSMFLARSGEYIAGCAAIEVYGREGLLRSLAVRSDYRGLGLGEQLTRRVLQAAAVRGVSRVYLLTETAENYFPRFGFVPVERVIIPATVKQSAEFSGACPESAQAMLLDLESWKGK